jgi:hypothetical protein
LPGEPPRAAQFIDERLIAERDWYSSETATRIKLQHSLNRRPSLVNPAETNQRESDPTMYRGVVRHLFRRRLL